jgi:NAD(P)-dependent dehydrogenase (short-subunit alcohol dehydrogenase family)
VTLAADVAKKTDVDRMVETVVARHGTVDILVNCAGTAKRAPALEQAEADWEYMIELNLKGTAWACRAVAPVMRRAGRGRIVNITSIGAEFGLVNRAAYCATKGGVAQLTRCLALEWGPHGITVKRGRAGDHGDAARAALPGRQSGEGGDDDPQDPARAAGQARRHGRRRRLPGVGPAAYITGQTIYIDGGWGVGDRDW